MRVYVLILTHLLSAGKRDLCFKLKCIMLNTFNILPFFLFLVHRGVSKICLIAAVCFKMKDVIDLSDSSGWKGPQEVSV